MIKTKLVKIKWNPKNREHYLSKGYKFTKWHDEIIVPIRDLPEGAYIDIELECDYCGEDFMKRFSHIKRIEKPNLIKKHACTECRKIQRKDAMLVESISEAAIKEYSKKIYKVTIGENEVYFKQCNKCKKHKEISCYRKNLESENLDEMYMHKCTECEKDYRDVNKYKFMLNKLKTTSVKNNLDTPLTEDQLIEITDKFESKCVFSGSSNYHYEHFIPVSWGHGGTHIGNIYLLSQSLNSSKNNMNPFKWIRRSDVRKKIDTKKWNKLIKYLADKNGLTVDQFEKFVYWCETNKRENVNDEDKNSLDQWKKSIEKEV